MRRLSHYSFHLEEMQAYFPSIWERIRHRCKHKGEHLREADISVSLVEGQKDSRKGTAFYQACLQDDVYYPFLWGGDVCTGKPDIKVEVKHPSAWSEEVTFGCHKEGYKLQNFAVHELMHGMGLGQTRCFVKDGKPAGCPEGCQKTLWETKMKTEDGKPLECYTGKEKVFIGGVELSRGGPEGHLMHPIGGTSQLSYGGSTEQCFFFKEDDLSLLSEMGYECTGTEDTFLIWIILSLSILGCLICACWYRRRKYK